LKSRVTPFEIVVSVRPRTWSVQKRFLAYV
jgi:hypothetical protein